MKKILFTLLTFIAFCGGAWADTPEIYINTEWEVDVDKNDVVVRPGGKGIMTVCLASNGEECRDMQIDITIPEGFSFVSWEQARGVLHGLGTNQVETPAGLTGSTMRFVLNTTNGTLFKDGRILRIYIKDNGYKKSGSFTGAMSDVILSCNKIPSGVKDFKYASIPFNVKMGEEAYQLYEDFDESIRKYDGVTDETWFEDVDQIEDYQCDVRVHRSLKAGQWNTIVLPFDMTEEQVFDAFGTDVQLADFVDGIFDEEKLSMNIQFNSLQERSIEAHHPYIIKTNKKGDIDAKNGFKVEMVDIARNYIEVDGEYIESAPEVWSEDERDCFTGTYRKFKLESFRTWISKPRPGYWEYHYLTYLSGNKFYYLNYGNDNYTIMKGFRGWFDIEEMVKFIKNVSSNANMNLFVDDEQITGIDGIPTSVPAAKGVYDLQGRKVSNELQSLKKGVYIIDGKKVVVK